MRSRNAETGEITITRDGVDFTLNAGDITFILDCQRMRRFERVPREHGWQPTVSWVGAEPDADDCAVSDAIIATLTEEAP